MFGLGFSEIIFLAVLALIVIGPKQLPEVARTLGRFLNDLKRNTESLTEDIKSKVQVDLNIRRQEVQLQMKKRQEELAQMEKNNSLPVAEEDRQMSFENQSDKKDKS